MAARWRGGAAGARARCLGPGAHTIHGWMAMALFKRKADSEREVADLRKRRGLLTDRLAAAERDLAKALDARRRALLESDLSEPAAEPIMIGRLRDEKDALVDALAQLDAKIAETEQRI